MLSSCYNIILFIGVNKKNIIEKKGTNEEEKVGKNELTFSFSVEEVESV